LASQLAEALHVAHGFLLGVITDSGASTSFLSEESPSRCFPFDCKGRVPHFACHLQHAQWALIFLHSIEQVLNSLPMVWCCVCVSPHIWCVCVYVCVCVCVLERERVCGRERERMCFVVCVCFFFAWIRVIIFECPPISLFSLFCGGLVSTSILSCTRGLPHLLNSLTYTSLVVRAGCAVGESLLGNQSESV
jgi:hypothetical protein